MEWAPVRDATLYTIIIVQEDTPSRRQVLTVSEELTNVNDLEPSTRYCIFVSAKNEHTQSNYSKECVTTGVPMWLAWLSPQPNGHYGYQGNHQSM